jgi:hypothetical protein
MEQQLIEFTFGLLNQVKLFHWATKSYAAHEALGDLHDLLLESFDDLVECYIGSTGKTLGSFDVKTTSTSDTKQMLPRLKHASETLRHMRSKIKQTELQNMIDEVLASLDKTYYLLNFS